MANPTLSKKQETNLTVNNRAKKLFQVVYREQNKPEVKDNTTKLRVSDLISKMAFYYEKIRNSVDYKEEHLLRKTAIERILKRLIVIEGTITFKEINGKDVAKNLLIELIRAGYLTNNTVPETKIDEIGKVISKYLILKKNIFKGQKINILNEKNELVSWIIAIAASEIEEKLGRSKIDVTVIDYMYSYLNKIIVIPESFKHKKDKEIQIFIGVHRGLLKFDNEMLSFILFKYFNANWDNASENEIIEIADDIISLKQAIDEQLEHPLKKQLGRIISRYTVFFSVLTDVIKEDPTGSYKSISEDPKAFPRLIKKMCDKRYNDAKKKLWRAAIRSIIYIFITKSVLAIAMEVPLTKLFDQEISDVSLLINITFPAMLLFFIVLMTRVPSDDNSNKVVEGINELIFEEKKREPYELRKPVKRTGIMNAIFSVLYIITFFISFGGVIWVLEQIHFNWVSMVIFLFFLTFVSFFSIRIRKGAHELMVLEQRENIMSFLVDFFYYPIVAVGKWLSDKFAKINVFVILLDFFIEAPFKIFVEIADEWTKYVKERKDDIV